MAVAKSIGRFILMEQEQLTGAEKRPPRMLVEIDSSEGLPGEIEIVWEGGSFIQQLDYWKIVFRCHKCRGVGHAKECCKAFSADPPHLAGTSEPVESQTRGFGTPYHWTSSQLRHCWVRYHSLFHFYQNLFRYLKSRRLYPFH